MIKKGALRRLFLFLYLAALSGPGFSLQLENSDAGSCPALKIDEVSQIRYIHDGDTIHLKDGRKVRLIGINTPELARDNKPAEAYAVAAKQALKSTLNNDSSVALVYGEDKKDRYGRLLAHAFTSEGENIQLSLLSRGYAHAINIPPNTRYSECYLEAETLARCSNAGLWQESRIIDADELTGKRTGFQLVRGKVKSIETNKKGVWLNLDNRLTVGIRNADMSLFDLEEIQRYLNKSLTVRGWVNNSRYTNPFYIRVRHPASLQLTSSIHCK